MMDFLYDSFNRYCIDILKHLDIPHAFYDDKEFYYYIQNRRVHLHSLSNIQLDNAIAYIRERKPYLLYFQQKMGLDGYHFNRRLYSFEFLDVLEKPNLKESYFNKCLKKPFIFLNENEQMTRLFFMSFPFMLLLREKYRRTL